MIYTGTTRTLTYLDVYGEMEKMLREYVYSSLDVYTRIAADMCDIRTYE